MTETNLKGCFIIEPKVFLDERGEFFESFHKKKLEEALGLSLNFVQDNQSTSRQGVLRGLHFQEGEHAQAKLVHVIKGEVLDVVVDLRPESRTFGRHISIELSDTNRKQIFIPKGMAHGFLVKSAEAVFAYKCDAYYHQVSESGIIYSDDTLNIDWEYPQDKILLSEKDSKLATFKEWCL
ncbi:dTDP-4-dehydrorhamnose 3,5-epimerase [Maribacter aestuarii]|uniref:dTDP-4-dehydrorhamnose 3,5-epimerase n=1 Tax=Maribacter aestuarii TaxID=1130723 RepID=UPI003222037F